MNHALPSLPKTFTVIGMQCKGACTHTPTFCRSRIRLRPWSFSHVPALPLPAVSWFWSLHKKDVCTHRNTKRNSLVLLYLRRKYKKRERQYWIHPILAVRYLEGSFYTLFEKLKSHYSKFFSYFRMSVSTFEFLVMRFKWSYKRPRYCNASLCLYERHVSSDN